MSKEVSNKPRHFKTGFITAVIALILEMDFYGVARISLWASAMMLLFLGGRAALIQNGQLNATKENVRNLKLSAVIWFSSVTTCFLTIMLNQPLFAPMPHLLTVYKIMCVVGYGVWGISLADFREFINS